LLNLVNAISIDGGFKLAVCLLLFVKYIETKEKVIFWLSMGWLFFGLHNITELLVTKTNYKFFVFINHILFLLPAAAFFECISNMQKPAVKSFHILSILFGIFAIIISFCGTFILKEWYFASIPTSFINGVGFILCAFYFVKFSKISSTICQKLIFLGLFLNGVHNLDYPFLRPIEWFAPIGFSLGVIFAIIFGIGLIIWTIEVTQKEAEKQKRILQELSILYDIVTTVNQTLNLKKILNSIGKKILEFTGVEIIATLLINEDKSIDFVYHYGLSKKFIKSVKKVLRKGETPFLNKILSSKDVKIIEDWTKEPTILQEAIKRERIKTTVFVPIKSKNKIIGLEAIVSHTSRKFTSAEIRLLVSLGNAVGVVIENSRLYNKLRFINRDLERIVKERTKELDNARKNALKMASEVKEALKKLKKTQKQLIMSERLAVIGRMAAMVSHELKNPLTGIKISTYYLKSKLKGKDKKIITSLENIEKEIERASNIINDILCLSREFTINPSLNNINAVIRDVLASIRQKRMVRNITIKTDLDRSIPNFLIDREKIREVITNLLLNAIEAMPNGGKLLIESKLIKKEVVIKINDTGKGISADKLKRIFEPFFTDKEGGTGLGLTLVKEIIKKHNGKVEVKSKLGKGTTFTIKMPLKN